MILNNTYPARPFLPHNFDPEIHIAESIPIIYITREALSDMRHYVDLAKGEVGWLGSVRKIDNDFLIEEVFLFKQDVSTASCDITPEGISEVVTDLINTRKDGMDICNRLQFWGHLHPGSSTSPSNQDIEQMDYFLQLKVPYFIRGIAGKIGKIEFTLYLNDAGLIITDVPWSAYDPIDTDRREQIEKEFQEKVRHVSVVKITDNQTFGANNNQTGGRFQISDPFEDYYGLYGLEGFFDDDDMYSGSSQNEENITDTPEVTRPVLYKPVTGKENEDDRYNQT